MIDKWLALQKLHMAHIREEMRLAIDNKEFYFICIVIIFVIFFFLNRWVNK